MSIRKEDNKTYTVIVYVDGKQIWRRGIKTLVKAKAVEKKLKSGIIVEKDPIMTLDTLSNYYFEYQRTYFSQSTVATNISRYKIVSIYLGKKKAGKIDKKDMEMMVNQLKKSSKNYSNMYINHMIETVNKILNWGVMMEYIEYNSVANFKKMKVTKDNELNYLTIDDFNKLLSVVEDEQYQLFLMILFYTGIRCGEALAIQYHQINHQNRSILINAHMIAKGGVKREPSRKNNKNYRVYLPDTTYELLVRHMEKEKKKDGFNKDCFLFGLYSAWSYNRVQKRFRKAIELSNLSESLTLHSLRHSFATLLINNGATTAELAAALGDTLEVVLSVYGHLYEDANKEVRNRINRILKNKE